MAFKFTLEFDNLDDFEKFVQILRGSDANEALLLQTIKKDLQAKNDALAEAIQTQEKKDA